MIHANQPRVLTFSAYAGGKLLEDGASSQSIHSMLWLLTGQGKMERVNWSRKVLCSCAVGYTDRTVQDCVMTLLALEAGLKVPEALFEVAASLETGEHEMQTRCRVQAAATV